MNPEEQLKQQFGTERPFRVPDGYFEKFASDLMSRLPEQKAQTVQMKPVRRTLPWLVAASFAGIIIFSGVYSYLRQEALQDPAASLLAQPATTVHGDEFEQAADYMMIDSDDMYAYLADY